MNEVEHYKDFVVGGEVICIINFRSSLTIGKIYKVEAIDVYNYDVNITVKNDDGYSYEYTIERFMPKGHYREHVINEIIK